MKYREAFNNKNKMLHISPDSMVNGVVSVNTRGLITGFNKAAQVITGWSENEVENKPFVNFFIWKNETTWNTVEGPVNKVLVTGKEACLGNRTVLVNKLGKHIPVACTATPIKDENNRTSGVVMVFRDIRKEWENQAKIRYLSDHDALTGLYNRRFLEKQILRLDVQSMLPIALIMGDVNGLKITNDVFGHREGDNLLKKVADAFNGSSRKQCIAARWGEDEFLAFLPNTSVLDAHQIIRRIQKRLTEKNDGTQKISVSMGCAIKSAKEEDLNLVLQEAEGWMYRQKLLDGQSYRNTVINTLLSILNEKSVETKEHAERLKRYCHMIGKELMLSYEEMDQLSLLAILHDIGKVGIRHAILQKPGPLTESEWDEIKKHPEIGRRIALHTPELATVAQYIVSHHERWDGKGYPRGLAGDEIPLLCRILAVVDTFDAMTNDRVYRKALSINEAILELEKNAGTQFDKSIVDVFVKLIETN
jgi:PAS domain S-box/diguanylate cyclase (GGDEF) domain